MKKEAPAFWLSMPKINYTLHKGQPVQDYRDDGYLRRIFKGYPPFNYRWQPIKGGLQ